MLHVNIIMHVAYHIIYLACRGKLACKGKKYATVLIINAQHFYHALEEILH